MDGTLLGRGGRCGGWDLPGGGRYGSESEVAGEVSGPASGHCGTGVGRDIAIPIWPCLVCRPGGACGRGSLDAAAGGPPFGRRGKDGWAICGGSIACCWTNILKSSLGIPAAARSLALLMDPPAVGWSISDPY